MPETEEGSDFTTQVHARETLETITEGLKASESFIATYIPELSNPPAENQTGPSPYVRLISATIKPDLTADYTKTARDAAQKIVAAHQQNIKGQHFVTYHSYGGSDDIFHIAVPFTSLDELDERVSNQELLQEVYGEDEAARLLEAVNQAVVKSASRVAEHHPFIGAIL
jgi:hypothetical protein